MKKLLKTFPPSLPSLKVFSVSVLPYYNYKYSHRRGTRVGIGHFWGAFNPHACVIGKKYASPLLTAADMANFALHTPFSEKMNPKMTKLGTGSWGEY